MVAFPFIRHPTFKEYIQFAVSKGCSASIRIDADSDIKLTKIESSNNTVISALSHNEILSPNIIRNYDSLLGIESEWLKFDTGSYSHLHEDEE